MHWPGNLPRPHLVLVVALVTGLMLLLLFPPWRYRGSHGHGELASAPLWRPPDAPRLEPPWDERVSIDFGTLYGRLVLVASGLGLLYLAHSIIGDVRRLSRRDAGRCPACGYDLRATPDRCPECGRAAASEVPR